MTLSYNPVYKAIYACIGRDAKLLMRRPGEVFNPVAFFLLAAILFPLALSPEPRLLAQLAPAVLWVALLLAALLGLEGLFRSDVDDGWAEQMILAGQPLSILILARVLTHWAAMAVPLLLVAWPVARALYLPPEAIPTLILSLGLGSLCLSLFGGLGAALTSGLRSGGVLLALLALPLMVPPLILGARATHMAANALDATGPLLLLLALTLLALSLLPIAVAHGLRIAIE
jgi:heme exporter protein B